MMVPRLYGLGDLSQNIDERAYLQARFILSAMGDDLAAFVTTVAHRQSVEALQQHRFVLLLGDPASGKSTIGASLAIGALDDGAVFGIASVDFRFSAAVAELAMLLRDSEFKGAASLDHAIETAAAAKGADAAGYRAEFVQLAQTCRSLKPELASEGERK